MLNLLKNNLQKNLVGFILTAVAAVVGLVNIIVYASTGYIKGFTEEYSVAFFIASSVAVLVSVLNLFKRVDTVETIPTIGYFLALVFFLVVNSNYLVAVIRAIDVTRVNGTFVLTIVFGVVAFACSVASLFFKEKE